MDEIKNKMERLIRDGIVKGHMGGPKDNVLICETLEDFCIASGELVQAGYNVASPGGYGGSAPESRQATHQKVWGNGTLCAVSFKRKTFVFFGLFSQDEEYIDIVDKQ